MKYIILGIFSLFILAGCLGLPDRASKPLDSSVTEQKPTTNDQGENSNTEIVETIFYTMEEIASHKSADNCWLLISGKVYDVTSFIAGGKHGGGDAILAGCGIDATTLYETRPMGSGTPHSDKAYGYLASFYIGELKN